MILSFLFFIFIIMLLFFMGEKKIFVVRKNIGEVDFLCIWFFVDL